ncbi:MAG: hypothetical protein WCJ56_00280 [bacterium]
MLNTLTAQNSNDVASFGPSDNNSSGQLASCAQAIVTESEKANENEMKKFTGVKRMINTNDTISAAVTGHSSLTAVLDNSTIAPNANEETSAIDDLQSQDNDIATDNCMNSEELHQSQHADIIADLAYFVGQEFPCRAICSHDHSGMFDYHVNSCQTPGQRVLGKLHEQPPLTPLQVGFWGTNCPEINFAVQMGAISGLVAVYATGTGLSKLDEIVGGNQVATPTISTSNGLFSLYIIEEDDVINSKVLYSGANLDGEVGIKGENSVVIFPPSIEANGDCITWMTAPWDVEFAPLPAAIRELMSPDDAIHEHIAADPKRTQALIDALAQGCPRFKRDWDTQQAAGLDKKEWWYWTALFVATGQHDAAYIFSQASSKHNRKSVDAIKKLDADKESCFGFIRCSTMGCVESQIKACHGVIRNNGMNGVSNSPGTLIQKATNTTLDPAHQVLEAHAAALKNERGSIKTICGFPATDKRSIIPNANNQG